MTKKDYIRIGSSLRTFRFKYRGDAQAIHYLHMIVDLISSTLKDDNSAFSRDRFREFIFTDFMHGKKLDLF